MPRYLTVLSILMWPRRRAPPADFRFGDRSESPWFAEANGCQKVLSLIRRWRSTPTQAARTAASFIKSAAEKDRSPGQIRTDRSDPPSCRWCLKTAGKKSGDFLFTGRRGDGQCKSYGHRAISARSLMTHCCHGSLKNSALKRSLPTFRCLQFRAVIGSA
jgi:hypothetical protein